MMLTFVIKIGNLKMIGLTFYIYLIYKAKIAELNLIVKHCTL